MNNFLRVLFHPTGKLALIPYSISIGILSTVLIIDLAIVDMISPYNILTSDFFFMSLGRMFILVVLEYGFPLLWFGLYILIAYGLFIVQIKRLRFLVRSTWWILLSLNLYWWVGPLLLLAVQESKASKA